MQFVIQSWTSKRKRPLLDQIKYLSRAVVDQVDKPAGTCKVYAKLRHDRSRQNIFFSKTVFLIQLMLNLL